MFWFEVYSYTLRPPLSGHFPKSRFICQQTAVFDTSLQRPPLLRCRGHLFVAASVLFIWFFTSIKRPGNYLSMKYLEINFLTYYTVDAKRPEKLVNDVLHYFCTLSTRKNTVHFNYVPSVLELELCMGWKRTRCFATMNFGFIFIYAHFLQAFCHIYSIKSCLLPFLSNLYCTSIKRPASIKRPLFKVPRVAA